MKAILLATALALGGAAYAQDTTTQSMPPDNPMPTPDGADDMPDTMPPEPMPDATTLPAPTTSPQHQTHQGMPAPQPTPHSTQGPIAQPIPAAEQPNPPQTSPGGPVIFQPSRPVEEVFPPPPPKDEYPPCSATVTDGCIQLYEPGIPG